jgi:GMP synthase (glutamine-hydrolysing)
MQNKTNTCNILILDFGSQFTQLIARRIRDLGVYCEVVPYNVDVARILSYKPLGIILSGGPNSVNESTSPELPENILNLNIPILGICYGMQIIAKTLGGLIKSGTTGEFGYAQLLLKQSHPLVDALFCSNMQNTQPTQQQKANIWMSHGDKVGVMPQNFICLASTDTCEIAAMADLSRHIYGVQFHPEVTHTENGGAFLNYFITHICACPKTWTTELIIEESIAKIRELVGEKHVLLGLSGGVDSSVAAVLIHKAIGKQLTCVFVDNGLLRLNEAVEVQKNFAENLGIKLICVDAKQLFLNALSDIEDPEQKRKVIGKTFIDVFDDEAQKLNNIEFLAQGTIYSDVIESAKSNSGASHTIKSHHNVGGLPDYMKLKLLEPLRYLFKDEVRKLGVGLGLPASMVYRHPFPGPGLGVRILGNIKVAYIELLQKADAIFIHELQHTFSTEADASYGLCSMQQVGKSWYDLVSQAFVVFLPVKSVGVMGDGRTYDYVVALRAVQTIDFMTAQWARLPYDLLARISNRIINEVKGINRVTYDISGKPPSTIEWE